MMTVTTTQIWTFIIGIVGLILTVLNIADKMSTMKKNADAPMKELQTKVTELEVKYSELKTSLDVSHERHREQQEVNYMFVNCMVAFIDFEVAYCTNTGYKDTHDLVVARDALRNYLTKKR